MPAKTYKWVRVTRANHCPICDKPDYCTVAPDAGIVCCMRQESSRPSRNALGGWIHVIGDKSPAYVKPEAKPEPPRVNCTKLIRDWRASTSLDWIVKLGEQLGVLPAALESIGVAWAAPYRAWAFPMTSGFGDVVGIRLRDKNGRKWAVTGSKQGLFVPDWKPERRMFITEGPTDLAAAISLGVFAIGRPSCQGAEEEVNQTIKRFGVREVVIIADNDDKVRPDGTRFNPGLDGAEKLASVLKVRSVVLTLPAKDTRDFLRNGGTIGILDYIVGEQVWRKP